MSIIWAVTAQFIILFGSLIIPSVGIYMVGIGLSRVYIRLLGHRRAIYFTGWIGTPIHELSHAIVALFFRFRLQEIQLFRPDDSKGTLGSVSYSPRGPSYIQKAGIFFIGLAPLVGGSFAIYILLLILIPEGTSLFCGAHNIISSASNSLDDTLASIFIASIWSFRFLFDTLDFFNWRHLLFFYLALAIATHMAPSRHDLNHCQTGLAACLIIAFGISVLSTVVSESGVDAATLFFHKIIAVPSALLTIALVMGLIVLCLSWGVGWISNLRHR